MEDFERSPEFRHFLQAAIPAVDAAELLLLFHSLPQAWLSPAEAVRGIGPGASLDAVQRHIEVFEALGLVSGSGGNYRFLPGTPLLAAVEQLAQAYLERPVTLVRMIYALRDSGTVADKRAGGRR